MRLPVAARLLASHLTVSLVCLALGYGAARGHAFAVLVGIAFALALGRLLGARWAASLAALGRSVQALRRGTTPPVAAARRDEWGEIERELARLGADQAAQAGRLREESARLRGILDGMVEGVMVTDASGTIALWNESFQRLVPAIPPEGKLPLEVVRSSALQEGIEAVTAGGAPVVRELLLPGDRTFLVRIGRSAKPASEKPEIVAVFHDVTELRRAERTRRDFLANASHELRTPIATIRAAAETLASEPALDEKMGRFVQMIERQAERMGRLVGDMLRLSELESGYRPAPARCEVAPLVEPVLAAARTRLGASGPSLIQEIEPGLAVMADSASVEQILTNLVDNACKHTPQTGTVRARGALRDGQVWLEVSDDGAGIARAHLPRLFERFYRADPGRAREQGGAGLGLAIVKHLAAANKGEVTVASELGQGTTFTVRLPSAP